MRGITYNEGRSQIIVLQWSSLHVKHPESPKVGCSWLFVPGADTSSPIKEPSRCVPRPHLTMLDVRDGAILVDMNVEAVGLVILRDHHAGLNDPVLLGEILLAETLSQVLADHRLVCQREGQTHRLIALLIMQRLSDKLVGPLIRLLVSRLGLNSWNDERHLELWLEENVVGLWCVVCGRASGSLRFWEFEKEEQEICQNMYSPIGLQV